MFPTNRVLVALWWNSDNLGEKISVESYESSYSRSQSTSFCWLFIIHSWTSRQRNYELYFRQRNLIKSMSFVFIVYLESSWLRAEYLTTSIKLPNTLLFLESSKALLTSAGSLKVMMALLAGLPPLDLFSTIFTDLTTHPPALYSLDNSSFRALSVGLSARFLTTMVHSLSNSVWGR